MCGQMGAGHSLDSPAGHSVQLEYNLHVMYRICIRCSYNFHPSALALQYVSLAVDGTHRRERDDLGQWILE